MTFVIVSGLQKCKSTEGKQQLPASSSMRYEWHTIDAPLCRK